MSWDCGILLPSPCSVSRSSYSVMDLCDNTGISCPQRLRADAKSILWTHVTQPALRANGLGQKPRGPPLVLSPFPMRTSGCTDARMFHDHADRSHGRHRSRCGGWLRFQTFPIVLLSPFSRNREHELFFVA